MLEGNTSLCFSFCGNWFSLNEWKTTSPLFLLAIKSPLLEKKNKDFANKAELIIIVIYLYKDGKAKKPEFETICFFALMSSKRNLTSCTNVSFRKVFSVDRCAALLFWLASTFLLNLMLERRGSAHGLYMDTNSSSDSQVQRLQLWLPDDSEAKVLTLKAKIWQFFTFLPPLQLLLVTFLRL